MESVAAKCVVLSAICLVVNTELAKTTAITLLLIVIKQVGNCWWTRTEQGRQGDLHASF